MKKSLSGCAVLAIFLITENVAHTQSSLPKHLCKCCRELNLDPQSIFFLNSTDDLYYKLRKEYDCVDSKQQEQTRGASQQSGCIPPQWKEQASADTILEYVRLIRNRLQYETKKKIRTCLENELKNLGPRADASPEGQIWLEREKKAKAVGQQLMDALKLRPPWRMLILRETELYNYGKTTAVVIVIENRKKTTHIPWLEEEVKIGAWFKVIFTPNSFLLKQGVWMAQPSIAPTSEFADQRGYGLVGDTDTDHILVHWGTLDYFMDEKTIEKVHNEIIRITRAEAITPTPTADIPASESPPENN